MGIDQYLFEKALKLSITYFQIRFYNLIKYYTDPATWNSTYRNAQKAKSLGMEYSADLNLFDGRLMVAASCTSTSTKDYSTDRPIARVPFNQFNINVNVKPVPQLNINTNISHMGPRFDVGTDKIKAYTLVDLTAEYEIMKGISIRGWRTSSTSITRK
jgi:vitamin B12 transporter